MEAGISSLSTALQDRYGPLLNLVHLADILHRSPDGLRIALRGSSTYADRINATRLKIGRRIYFRTSGIAEILTGTEGLE